MSEELKICTALDAPPGEIMFCQEDATWEGENQDGEVTFVCDKHKSWLENVRPIVFSTHYLHNKFGICF